MLATTKYRLRIADLQNAYESGERSPTDVLAEVRSRIAAYERKNVWITLLNDAQIAEQIQRVESLRRAGVALPLYGIPFAVKDNIDVAGVPTTAGCPAFAYTPERSATVVRKLCEAGAIVVGKTNLDQFATGLVGTRTPYGACENAFDPAYISGGSSSGSAVAVAGELVSFSLGTDTAGSGRIPASFNNLVGLKPSRGLLSNTGVVPACRSLDCVSIFAASCAEAAEVLRVAAGLDESDPLSHSARPAAEPLKRPLRIGIPSPDLLEFFGNTDASKLFADAVDQARALGAKITTIDFEPFKQAANLLYEGAWVAERLLAGGEIFHTKPEALRPELRTILKIATKYSALDVFDGAYQMSALRRAADVQWMQMDVMMTPTAGTIYTIAEVEADPMQLNRNLGYYTNFVNLLDLSAIAIPSGFLPSGLPMGVTFHAPAFSEAQLLAFGSAFHKQANPRRDA